MSNLTEGGIHMKSRVVLTGAVLLVLAGGLPNLYGKDSSDAPETTPIKIVVKGGTNVVGGQEFPDQELEDSARDIRNRMKPPKFLLVSTEDEAAVMLVVVKRETSVGQPKWYAHKTARNVNDLHVTLSTKENGKWKPGAALSSQGCCKYWTDAAGRVVREVKEWLDKNYKGAR